MDYDAYSLCPCGSGKKLKFCCQDVANEMSRIERLAETNQPRLALQRVEKLYETHPDSGWVVRHLANALAEHDELERAMDVVVRFLKKEPEHPCINADYAELALTQSGYPGAAKAVRRAYKVLAIHNPSLIPAVAITVCSRAQETDQPMAARQHLALAMRFSNEQTRQQLFTTLLRLDGDIQALYPFRGIYTERSWDPPADQTETCQKAERLGAVGCWDEAAELLTPVAEQTRSAAAWFNVGLYRAWSADRQAAVEAFRNSAEADDDFDRSVEAETLAQLLELWLPENQVKKVVRAWDTSSLSQLVSRLAAEKSVVRSAAGEQKANGEEFVLLDRPVEGPVQEFREDAELPVEVGRVIVMDGLDDEPPKVLAVVLREESDKFVSQLDELVGDLVDRKDEEEDDPYEVMMPRPIFHWSRSGFLHPETPPAVIRAFHQRHWQQLFEGGWENVPMPGLGGTSPAEAKGNEDRKRALAAAVNVFDAYCDTCSQIAPVEQLRARLDVPEPQPPADDELASASTINVLTAGRIDPHQISPEVLCKLCGRLSVLRNARLSHRFLAAAVARDDVDESRLPRAKAYDSLARICAESLRFEEAIEWSLQARQLVDDGGGSFEDRLRQRLKELYIRVMDPDDPGLSELLSELWGTFAAKLPNLRAQLQDTVTQLGIEPPWSSDIVTPEEGGSEFASAGAASGGEKKKLWLPGSD